MALRDGSRQPDHPHPRQMAEQVRESPTIMLGDQAHCCSYLPEYDLALSAIREHGPDLKPVRIRPVPEAKDEPVEAIGG